jgi:hypothetical protein
MFTKTTIGMLLLFSLLGLNPQRTSLANLQIQDAPISVQIDHFAKLYGVDGSIVSKVIECESEGRHYAENGMIQGDGGLSMGIAQFQKSTFERMEKKLGEDLNYESSFDQIKLLSFAISQGWGREWTAYRAIMNGGTYSFYSRQLNKHFTVHCK